MKKPFKERLQKTIVKTTNGCWAWTGAKNKQGYGLAYDGIKTTRAHRASWECFRGKIPNGLCVLHKCDNPECINPDHLFIGTHADNSKDRGLKGRTAKGNLSGKSKLKESEIPEIRYLLTKGISAIKIGSMYKVAQNTILSIKSGRTWSHVK